LRFGCPDYGADAFDGWLEGSPEEALALARPFPASAMHIVHEGDKRDAG